MQQFDDIRPYLDHEVPDVVARLASDPDFIEVVGQFRFARLSKWFPWLMHKLIRAGLRREAQRINTVQDLQLRVEPYVTQVIEQSTEVLTFSGLERLEPGVGYLFVSNHRDIVMDPALVNYGLHQQQLATAQIAIGDNLLGRPFVSDLMRLNKSFIVKRSPASRREKLVELTRLSAYINHCIEENQSVWIAQAEGRAKDGDDQTDTAIIKMFHMSQRKSEASFAEVIQKLRIVPVSISYEFDPCDQMKARELNSRELEGRYDKEENEDLNSIVQGIMGNKGRVHVAFGEELQGDFSNAQEVAAEIDRQIFALYRLQPSNWTAYMQLRHADKSSPWPEPEQPVELGAGSSRELLDRFNRCPVTMRHHLLKMYAQPVINQLRHGAS